MIPVAIHTVLDITEEQAKGLTPETAVQTARLQGADLSMSFDTVGDSGQQVKVERRKAKGGK